MENKWEESEGLKVVELQEDRNLFARLVMVTKSFP